MEKRRAGRPQKYYPGHLLFMRKQKSARLGR